MIDRNFGNVSVGVLILSINANGGNFVQYYCFYCLEGNQ